MNRRTFFEARRPGWPVVAPGHAADSPSQKPKRVGLIGSGWYGKCDLFRLIQVAPVEVVSLCDVDRADARRGGRDGRRQRQASKKKPRTYGDYREMLKEKDLDIVLIATPDHWHALPMIAAVRGRGRCLRAEADQRRRGRRPGDARRRAQAQARRAGRHAAPQHAAPHRGPRHDRQARASSARSALVEIYCYYHMRASEQSARHASRPSTSTTRCGPARRRMRPYNELVASPRWRAFMEYGNGIVGDMCIHMLDMVRWMLDLGWPKRDQRRPAASWSTRTARSNIADTQTATFDFGDLDVVWQHRTWGQPPDPEVSLGRDVSTATRARSRLSVNSYDFTPNGGGDADPPRRRLRARAISRGQDREGPGAARRPGHSRPHAGLPGGDRHARQAGGRHRARAHLDGELHPGQPRRMQLGRTLTWDAAKGQVVGDDEANRLLPAVSGPWVHPATV